MHGIMWSLLYIYESIIECYHENVTDESESKMKMKKKKVLQQYQGQEWQGITNSAKLSGETNQTV